jgi:Protein of unknown function (DUF2924)
MARSTARWQAALPPIATDLDAELDRLAKLGVEELRAMWRERRGQAPPEALSKDLIARALAYWLQEEYLGGLASPLRKILASLSEGHGAHATFKGWVRHRPGISGPAS